MLNIFWNCRNTYFFLLEHDSNRLWDIFFTESPNTYANTLFTVSLGVTSFLCPYIKLKNENDNNNENDNKNDNTNNDDNDNGQTWKMKYKDYDINQNDDDDNRYDNKKTNQYWQQ